MQITLETSKGTAYYYTRVVSRSGLNVDQYVKFVKSFYEKSMDKASAEDLTSYLEPVDTGASANYNDVNINSTFNQISWGSLSPQIYKKGIPVIKDINETTASISLEYQIMARDGDSAPEIYDVTEFYRMRYTSSRIMLLDFERSASQVFDENNIKISQDGLLLGVRSRDVEYMTNETAGVAAFCTKRETCGLLALKMGRLSVFSASAGMKAISVMQGISTTLRSCVVGR